MKKYSFIIFCTGMLFIINTCHATALYIKFHQPVSLGAKRDTPVLITGIEQLFIPGKVPVNVLNNAAPAFLPDESKVYFGQHLMNGSSTIMVSQKRGNKWSLPVAVSFSGIYRDLEPAIAPSGKYLIFASNRPVNPGDSLLEGYYNGKHLQAKGGNLWKVGISNGRTGTPERISAVVNSSNSTFSPAITGDGSLYFMKADSGSKFHIYRATLKNGSYQKPIKVSFSLDGYGDFDPVVAPDESFLIFSSSRPPAVKRTDLFIVFRGANGWGEPIDLAEVLGKNVYGIEARLSPDLKTLYFTNAQNEHGVTVPDTQYIWSIGMETLIAAHHIHLKNRPVK